ncbi:MAG: hypothetical protein AAF065_12570 [Verrucomicrobiota bacterium]
MQNLFPELAKLRYRSILIGCVSVLSSLVAEAETDALVQIVNLDGYPAYEQRHNLLHNMKPPELSAGSSALIQFIELGNIPAGMEEDEYLSLANDIYDKLLNENIAVQYLLDHALEAITDDEKLFVWRDYCVQKLADILPHPGVSPESSKEGLDVLKEVIEGNYPEMQGTALIVATQLEPTEFAKEQSILNAEFIGQKALACASDDEKPLIDRVTALQVAGRYAPDQAVAYASSLLDENQANVATMLKLSAIAMIGQVGDQAHMPLLEPFRRSADVRMRKAARIAIERLDS